MEEDEAEASHHFIDAGAASFRLLQDFETL